MNSKAKELEITISKNTDIVCNSDLSLSIRIEAQELMKKLIRKRTPETILQMEGRIM